MLELTREQVLAYRVAAQGLLRDGRDDVLDAGVQDSPPGSARLALAARGLDPAGLATVWSFRGAPHLHRAGEVRALATGLWPLGEADAVARLAGLGSVLRRLGESALEAYAVTAAAIRDALRAPATKGELSAAVTARVPGHLSAHCRGCATTHVNEQLFRVAALPAGARIVPGTSPPVFEPIPGWPGVPAAADGTAELVVAYLRLLGPAGPAEAAGYLGTTRKAAEPAWPDGLAAVTVGGRPSWLPADRVDAVRAAPRERVVRLLPPSDPWLQARDRELIVPDAGRHKQLWRILGNPGAVLVGGEVAGTWRAKLAGRRLDVTVTAFEPLPETEVAAEAERVAAARGAGEARVSYGGTR